MKLLRYGAAGFEKPGCLDKNGQIRDLSHHIKDFEENYLLPESLEKLRKLDPDNLPLVDNPSRIGPCVNRVGKLVCIGLNYADHAAETGAKIPAEPVVFAKATSSICGPNDNLIIPAGSEQTDWEVELGVIIGKPAKRVREADALNYVAGYCVINDFSEREYQLKISGQWLKGKSCDTFGPIGPWLVTADEVSDPQNLALWLDVDNKRYQNGNTKDMIFPIRTLISHISQFFTLHPGDIISTGTPAGVGRGQKPNPIYLKPGQQVKLGVSGLGEQSHQTVSEVF
jgi:2,4-diketo-3-deoxy-L-fuconate hydrolase